MPDNIKIVIGGDANQLNSELKKTQAELAKTGVAANKLDSSLGTFGKQAGQSIFNLTEKLRQLQSNVFTEKDRGKIALFNQEIKATEAEILKLNALGTGAGATGAFGGITAGASKAFGVVRQLAYILPGVGIAGIIGFATEPIIGYISALFGATEAEKRLEAASADAAKAQQGIFKETGKEAAEVTSLVAILENQNETYARKASALKELKSLQPDYFNGLKLEGNAVAGLDAAYRAYLDNLQTVIKAKILQARLETEITKLIALQASQSLTIGTNTIGANLKVAQSYGKSSEAAQKFYEIQQKINDVNASKLTGQQSAIDKIFKDLIDVSKGIRVPELKVKVDKVKVEKDGKDPIMEGLLKNRSFDVNGKPIKISPIVEVDPVIKKGDFEQRLFDYRAIQEAAEKAGAKISSILESTFEDALAGLGENLGQIITGQASFDSLFKGLFNTLGAGLKELGKYFIQTAIEVKVFKAFITKNPLLAAAAGIALIAIGSAIQASTAKKQAFASGTTNFQGGGVALVGERGPERIFLPNGARVQPNNELVAAQANSSGFVASTRISGTDLVILIERGRASLNRGGGIATYGG